MEAELSYYRGLLFASSVNAAATISNKTTSTYVTSYPTGGEYRSISGGSATAGGEYHMGGYDSLQYAYTPAKAMAVISNEFQRAGSYDSSSTGTGGTYSPALDKPLDSFSCDPRTSPLQRNPDGTSAAWPTYMQFNTEVPIVHEQLFKSE